MVLEIPGFFWDEEKRKYFAIQPSHAGGSGSQHTTDSVKRKREEQEDRVRKTFLKQKSAKERIVAAKSLQHPSQLLNREISSRISPAASLQEQIARSYVLGLEMQPLHTFNSWLPPSASAPSRQSRATAVRVLREPRTGTIILGGNSGPRSRVSICQPGGHNGPWNYQGASDLSLLHAGSNLTSLSLDPHGILLSTFDAGGPNGRAFLRLHSLSPDSVTSPSALMMPAYTNPLASAACPSAENARFAIGAEGGLFMLEGLGNRWELARKEFSDGDRLPGGAVYHQKVHSVDWMSSTLLACALRVSKVCLYDHRSGGSATQFLTGGCNDKIRRADDHRIVVAGQDFLRLYDLRFPRSRVAPGLGPQAQPYLSFTGYSRSLFPDVDVSSELGVLVTTSGKNDFQLWSLQTGAEILAPPGASRRYSNRPSPICVAFEATGALPNEHGAQAPNLLVGSSHTVDQWSW